MKTIKGFNIKRSFIILIPENSFELGIVVLIIPNKMLLVILTSTFTFNIGWDPKNPVFQFVPISNTQCYEWVKF